MQVSDRWESSYGTSTIWDICIEPGSQRRILFGCGSTLYLVNSANGEIESKYPNFHTNEIFTVSWTKDSEEKDVVASGGKDNHVIIWDLENDNLTPRVKYPHTDTIQRVRFSPLNDGRLVSAASGDFGLFSPDNKDVAKTSVGERITDICWSPLGDKFAYGTQSGRVSIRSGTKGTEKIKLDRDSEIWAMEWLPVENSKKTQLIVYDWYPSVTIYDDSGSIVSPSRQIDFDPCCCFPLTKMPYLAVGGSFGNLALMSKDGIKLQHLTSDKCSFIWSVIVRQIGGKQEVISGNNKGEVKCNSINLSRVHGLYRNQYACRDNLTDILVRYLDSPSEGVIRIKCREIISKIAIFDSYLAVQCHGRMKIFSRTVEKFENISVFDVPENTNLIVCATMAVVICQGERLTCYDFTGVVTREWVLGSTVRYVKMLPGIPGSECMLVATTNGSVSKIFLDSSFPIEAQKINSAVYICDFDQYRNKLLILDDKNLLSIYDVNTQELLYQEPNCTSASFNADHDGLLCFTTHEELIIKTENKVTFRQKLKVNQRCVGFYGSWVYLLDGSAVENIQVPQTGAIYHYMEEGNYDAAYEIACIGVTASDWKYFGNKTLKKLRLNLAKKAFAQTKDYRMLSLINDLIKLEDAGSCDDELLAIICAYEGDFNRMEGHLRKSGKLETAVKIYTDLRMFDKARTCLTSQNTEVDQRLLKEEAAWADTGLGDQRAAAEMYLQAGESMRAIEALASLKSAERLVDIARKLDKGDRKALDRCAELLAELGQTAACSEIYGKMGDWEKLLELYALSGQWDEAFALVNRYPELSQKCWTLRADWLAEHDMFIEAQQAFHEAGKEEEALCVLLKLTACAVTENRYNDAAHYYFLLSKQCLELAKCKNDPGRTNHYLKQEEDHLSLSEIYYAYHFIHRYVEEPFTNILEETLLYASRFLWVKLQNKLTPPGISKVYVLYAFAKISRQLGCWKTARYCYNQLQHLKIPRGPIWETIQFGSVSIRGKPYHDNEDYNITCPRCATQNSLISSDSISGCANCQQDYIFSFSNFEPMPLVEFKFDEDISDQEAFGLIDTDGFNPDAQNLVKGGPSYDRLDLSESMYGSDMTFEKILLQSDGEIVLSKDMIRKLSHSEVLVRKYQSPKRWQFFKNVIPSYQLKIDPDSFHFYQAEDWEMLLLQTGQSPFSRRKIVENEQELDVFEDL